MLYRTFAHKFNWLPDKVDEQPVALLAAFIHDFEAERVRTELAGDDDAPDLNYVLTDVDQRIPLKIRTLPLQQIEAWVKNWNASRDEAEWIQVPGFRPKSQWQPKL